MDQGLNVNQISRMGTKQRTFRGHMEPHQDLSHPAQKEELSEPELYSEA